MWETAKNGGERRIRTFERITRADLQSAAFGHLAISPNETLEQSGAFKHNY